MRAYLLLLLCCIVSVISIAQRPDSVQLNGEWYFIYPMEEQVLPAYTTLRKTKLSEKQFDVLLQWKLDKDPRATLRYRQLEDSINAELLRTNRILTKEQNFYNWEEGTEPPSLWGGSVVRKKVMRRFPVMNVVENDPATYDLVPTVTNLPDGKYIQYFAPFLTYDKTRKMEVISGKTAAVFELKDNLLNGSFIRFNYNGDTTKLGTFSEGLKEGKWLLELDVDYYKGEKKGTLRKVCSKISIDLKAGVPQGKFQVQFRNDAAFSGQYDDGFAYGKWIKKHGSQEEVYHNIIHGSNLLNHPEPVVVISENERCNKSEGFDFAEWKGRYRTPDLYNEFIEINSIVVQSKTVSDFETLKDEPLMGTTVKYRSKSYYATQKTNSMMRFSGSKEVYIEGWLEERITIDTVTHTLGYSQYYENGNLYDTMAFSSVDSMFHYRLYDVNGKLYIESSYDLEGNLLDKVCYAQPEKEKPEKTIRNEFQYMEGFPAFVDRHFYTENRKLSYVWYNNKDSIIDGKKYKYIAWSYETKKRLQEEFYRNDTLHELFYNDFGKPTLEVESIRVLKKVRSNVISVPYEFQYTSYWDQWKWVASRDTSGDFSVKMYQRSIPYSGQLQIRFSRKKVEKNYFGGGNELILTLPRYGESRRLEKYFLAKHIFSVDENQFHSNSTWSYGNDIPVFYQMLNQFLTKDLFNTIYQKELEGPVENGIPDGSWDVVGRNNKGTTQLEFENRLPAGSVVNFVEYEKPDRFDRRWKESDPFYDQKFSKKAPRYYPGIEYHLKNGKYDGLHLEKGVNNDTLYRLNYSNGLENGRLLRTYGGDSITGTFVDGRAQGDFLVMKYEALKTDTLVRLQFTDGKLEGDFRIGVTDFYNNYYLDEGETTDVLDYLRGHCSFDQLNGRITGYTGEHLPLFGLTFSGDTLIDTVFFYENYDVSYYYDRLKTPPLSIMALLTDSIFWVAASPARVIVDPIKRIASNLVDGSRWYTPVIDRSNYLISDFSEEMDKQKFGYLTKLYPNNRVARTGYRLFNKSIGMWYFYNYDGQLLYTIDYSDTTSREDAIGLYTEYAPNGDILSKRIVVEELEKYDCAHSDYYAIRQFIVVEDTPDAIDHSNGLQKNYFDNGVLMSEGNLKNGLPDGVWKFFTPDGRLTIVGKYINGKKEGRWLYGDLGDKKYIGEICLNPDDPFLDFHIAELEKKKDIQVQIYKEGKAMISQFHELNE